jgi:signal transduction histidine kinase
MTIRRRKTALPSLYSDLAVVKRAGRVAALQTSVALALILLVVGGIAFAVFTRAQNRQIEDELRSVAVTADDANDPPPNMELVLHENDGRVAMSPGGRSGLPLLAGPVGLAEVNDGQVTYRTLVMDRDEGRVVAMMDMAPFRAARHHLLMAIGFSELAGIFASVGVVAVFSRRSARPLAQALALQRRFVADASHELRAPLTVLHTRAQLLLHRANTADAESVREEAEALVADTRALGAIVEDLLASAMMPLGKPVQDRVDLASVASSVCDSMAPHAGELGVQIACSCEKGSSANTFEVIGSEAALRRVFTSLIDNSLAHSKDNGSVDVRLRREDATVVVTVTDDGAGIDAEVLKTLFARFSQGPEEKSLQSRQGRQSYGIGLALVREVVQGHGGEITVSSSPGQRATFTMVFPAAP